MSKNTVSTLKDLAGIVTAAVVTVAVSSGPALYAALHTAA